MNPNFKPEMITDKLLKACEEQVQKYFGEREMDRGCGICSAMPISLEDNEQDCRQCPLGNGTLEDTCTNDPTFINSNNRREASKKQLLARGNRLIEILDEHGIEIYDEKL